MAETGLAKSGGLLVQLNKLDDALATARTLHEMKQVGTMAKAVAEGAKKIGADRLVVNRAVDILIRSMDAVGAMLGEGGRKWSKPGPGRGHKKTVDDDVKRLTDCFHGAAAAEASRCRAIHWKLGTASDTYRGYTGWLNGHGGDHLTVSQALVLTKLDDELKPEVIGKLTTGKAHTLAEAVRLVKRDHIVRGAKMVPRGQYRTIVIDPPWDMQKISREAAPNQEAFDYATMTVDEIKQMKVPSFSTASHIYLWTTQKMLPAAFEILKEWGFGYLVTMVWHKSGGFQPVGLPQYNCEFVLLGRKGGLGFLDTKDFMCCFDAKRREHSRKPDEFYDLVRRVSPEPRCDIFSREERDGFDSIGWEEGKFSKTNVPRTS